MALPSPDLGSLSGFCPDATDPGVRLYLRPVGLMSRAVNSGWVALPLAGGRFAFGTAELILRQGPGRYCRACAPVSEIVAWSRERGEAVAERVNRLLGAITRRRPPFAGLDLRQPRLMGVVNVTPDSFSDGDDFLDPSAAIAHGIALAEAGADLIDVGGESTRPGAEPVPAEVEVRRVLPVVDALVRERLQVSVDTRHAPVMAATLGVGAAVVNDVTALADPAALALVAKSRASVILMHMQGDPSTMLDAPDYDDVALDVFDWLEERVAACVAAGINPGRIAVDPGVGFGKTLDHNIHILRHVSLFHGLGCALVLGVSRKRFIAALSRNEPPKEREPGTLAAGLHALNKGAQILRVHDASSAAQARAVWHALHPQPH